MKTLRKIIPLMIGISSLSACTYGSVNPGPKENVIGTYELVKYEMHKVDADGNEILDEDGSAIKYNRKKEIGAVAYFSIAEDGYAFYAYKDNKTPAKASTMFATFGLNGETEEPADYVRSVNLKDGVTHLYEDQKYVGCMDEPTMFFRDDPLKKVLHYNLSGHMLFQPDRKIPYQYVEYRRVSTEASLEKVNKLMKTDFKFTLPYECKAFTGYAVYRCNVKDGAEYPNDGKGIYEYAVLDASSYNNGKYTVYYSLKENPGQQVMQVPAEVVEKGSTMAVTFDGRKFYGGTFNELAKNLETKQEEYDAESPISSESFTHWWSNDLTLQEVITNEAAWTNLVV